jgi:PAS domain S-box-containing protein
MTKCTSETIPLGIGGARVPLHAHVACFWETRSDFAATLGFLEQGLNGSDYCVLFGYDRANVEACRILAGKGFDLERLKAERRLVLIGPAESGEATLDSIGQIFSAQLKAGAAVLRLLGNIGWQEAGWPGMASLLAMEAKVSLAAESFPCVIVCMYDIRTLPAIIIRHGALESHALTIHDNRLSDNPFFLPVDTAMARLEGSSEFFAEFEAEREAVQLYRGLFANMQDGLVVVKLNPEQPERPPRIVDVNQAARVLSRDPAADLTAVSAEHYMPELFDARFVTACRQTASSGKALVFGEVGFPGTTFYQVKIFPLFDDYLGVLLSDTTARRRTEEALLSLRRLSASVLSTVNFERILDKVVLESIAIVGAESGSVSQCCAEGFARCRYFVHGQPVPAGLEVPPGGDIPGRVIVKSGPYLSNDALNDLQIDPARAARDGIRSAINVPILDAGGQVIGYLEIHNKKDPAGFTNFDLEQLTSVAQIASNAITNAKAFQHIAQIGVRLRKSNERYQSLVDGLDAIVWEADVQSLQFTFVSRRAETILGYPVSQWLSEPAFWVNHIHPEDRDAAVRLCRLATVEGKDHQITYRAIAADGRAVWLRDHARVVQDSARRAVQLCGVMIDISESMALQDSLRESEARFRSTFEGAGIGIALVDREGHPLQSNPALQAMLGYGAGELAELSFTRFTHPEDLSRDQAQFQALMSGEMERYQMEKRLITKGGGEIWVLLTASLVRDRQGAPQYVIGMVEDITERKKGEAEIAQLLSRVRQDAAELERRVAERTVQLQEINEELDTFAYSISHDLRAPLRAVQSFAEILMEHSEQEVDPDRGEFLGRILSAAHGMDQLIQDLLSYSRLSRQDIMLQTVNLAQVVREVTEQLELTGGGGDYHLEICGELPPVTGNHAVLVQVLLNLFSNAIKYVAEGVTPELRLRAERREALVRVSLQDNGIGIAPQHRERIFKVFERLHGSESYPGTGVGLAIARKAVTRLGGRIGVDSEPGKGSTFWVELPGAVRSVLEN